MGFHFIVLIVLDRVKDRQLTDLKLQSPCVNWVDL